MREDFKKGIATKIENLEKRLMTSGNIDEVMELDEKIKKMLKLL